MLEGVSCTSAWACTAVGTSNGGTLAEQWNGTAWSIAPSPNGAAGQWNGLFGVSCTSASACTAVGAYDVVDPTVSELTLVEQWNGMTWSIVPSPNTSATQDNDLLKGVSCTSASACTAVGYDGTSGQTLVETSAILPLPPPPAAPVGVNALVNPLLTSGSGNSPTCWSQAGYGTNTPTYTWSDTGGYAGGEATISMAGLSSGDAKLVTTFDNGTCAPTVNPGDTYTMSVYYKSTVPVFFTLYGRAASGGTWSYRTKARTSPRRAPGRWRRGSPRRCRRGITGPASG